MSFDTSDSSKNNIETIDLNLLRLFVAVFEGHRATTAGARLGISQSAVSQGIAKLREIYLDPLFERTGRGFRPTLFARQIYPFAREALDQFAASFELHGNKKGFDRGRTITIGISDDFEIAFGTQLTDLSRRLGSTFRLHFRQTNSHLVSDMLMSREIDLAITAGGLSAEGISVTTVGRSNYACLLDPSTFGEELTRESYVTHEHVLVSSGGFFGLVDEVLADQNLRRKILVYTSHFSAIPYLLTGTKALTTIPRHVARKIAQISSLEYHESPFAFPDYPIMIGWRNFSRKDPLLLELINLFSEELPYSSYL